METVEPCLRLVSELWQPIVVATASTLSRLPAWLSTREERLPCTENDTAARVVSVLLLPALFMCGLVIPLVATLAALALALTVVALAMVAPVVLSLSVF